MLKEQKMEKLIIRSIIAPKSKEKENLSKKVFDYKTLIEFFGAIMRYCSL